MSAKYTLQVALLSDHLWGEWNAFHRLDRWQETGEAARRDTEMKEVDLTEVSVVVRELSF